MASGASAPAWEPDLVTLWAGRQNEAMTSEPVRCGHCGQANRVPAAAAGTPRCGKCHQPLAWIADADDATFAEVTDAAKVPVIVDLAPWSGPAVGQPRA